MCLNNIRAGHSEILISEFSVFIALLEIRFNLFKSRYPLNQIVSIKPTNLDWLIFNKFGLVFFFQFWLNPNID